MLLQEIINWVFSPLLFFCCLIDCLFSLLFCLCSIFIYLINVPTIIYLSLSSINYIRSCIGCSDRYWIELCEWTVLLPPVEKNTRTLAILPQFSKQHSSIQCLISMNRSVLIGMILQASVMIDFGSDVDDFCVCIILHKTVALQTGNVLWQDF